MIRTAGYAATGPGTEGNLTSDDFAPARDNGTGGGKVLAGSVAVLVVHVAIAARLWGSSQRRLKLDTLLGG